MRLSWLVLVALLFGACNSSPSEDRRYKGGDENAPDGPGEKVEAKFILPSSLPSGTALALTHFRYETQWRDAGCRIATSSAELPFAGREVIRLNLYPSCDYRLLVWIGFYEGSVWNSVYEASVIVDPQRDSAAATQIFVERTTDGERLGFPDDLQPLLDGQLPNPTDPTTPTGPTNPDNQNPTNPDSGQNGAADLTDVTRNDPDGDGIVEFRIPAGTGSGAWNAQATIVRIKVGQTLRIFNDDSISHQMHTNGAPCPHGNVIRPGSYGDCRATRPYSGAPLYDHNSRGDFFIEALP